MKRIVSISLGSAKRDHKTTAEFGGELFSIERIGVDGDKNKAIELIKDLDGKVDAFGLGGTDLYIYAGKKRYMFSESTAITAAAKSTPIVDGSGLKNTLERRVVTYLDRKGIIQLKAKNVLLMCAVDRFGMAESLIEAQSKVVFGDILFGLGLPFPIYRLETLARLASILAPVITHLPISLFYPTGKSQNLNTPRFSHYFNQADAVAGDFHFIRRYAPLDMSHKVIITNTVTQDDVEWLRGRGVATLVTTTPELNGRSYGTNVLEAILVALSGKRPKELYVDDYERLLDNISIEPRVTQLV